MDSKTLKYPQVGESFVANGTTYTPQKSLSYARWVMLQKAQVELSYTATVEQIFERLKKAYALLNEKKFADSAVVIYNIMKGISEIGEDQIPLVIRICALFINAEGEDAGTITEEQIEKKAKDWKEEGIDMNYFFQFALHSVQGFTKIYQDITQDTL